jgi:hypothetical protein
MKLLFENWRKYVNEDASKKEIEDAIVDVLKDEGGAAGLKPIKKTVEDLDLPDGFDLKDFLKGLRGVGQHEDGDYILEDGEEIDVKEGVEIFLEAQEDMLDEKRKRKKKKKKKKGKKDACYYKVKARYSVWPSAYASGALVKCRDKGAANWGTGGKKKKRKNESLSLEDIIREEIQNVLDERCQKGYKTHSKRKTKKMYGKTYRNCVKAEGLDEGELEEKKKRKKKQKRKLTAKPSSETSLRDWFGRKGAKGKKGGWVDCNTCRKNKKTGKKTCSACGRSGKEKRAKYPSCRPTPSACGKRGKYGKKSKAGKKG